MLETHRPPSRVPTLWLDASSIRSLSAYTVELPRCVSCTSTVQAWGAWFLINTHRFCPPHARASSPAGHHPDSKTTSVTPRLCSSGTKAHSISFSVSPSSSYSMNQDSVIAVRGNSRRATWVGPHAERPRFPGPPLRRTRGPDPSSKATLWGKAQHEGAPPPHASSAKTRGFHTQLDEGRPGSPRPCRAPGALPTFTSGSR